MAAGIAHLRDIFDKKGHDVIVRLLGEYVTINEKLDGSAFCFEKQVDGTFLFFKRNQEEPINLIDRTLVKYYEEPINHIESLPESIKELIPYKWRFGCEYFSNNTPHEIHYEELPQNKLILSYIHVKNANDKLLRTIQDHEELDEWAKDLAISKPPIIFQGVLNDRQKEKILDFVTSSFSEAVERFKTTSFVSYVISVLNPNMKRLALGTSLDSPIEGIVFRFGKDENVTLAKLIDPVFEEIMRAKAKARVETDTNLYELTLIDMVNYIQSMKFKAIRVAGKSYEEKYVDLVSKIFVRFINSTGDEYANIEIVEPDYLKRPEFALNIEMIRSNDAKFMMEEKPWTRRLFKIMLAAFRKVKRRGKGLMTSDVVFQFNKVVATIQNKCNNVLAAEEEDSADDYNSTFSIDDEDSIKESIDGDFLSFSEFRKKFFNTEDTESIFEDEDGKDDGYKSNITFGSDGKDGDVFKTAAPVETEDQIVADTSLQATDSMKTIERILDDYNKENELRDTKRVAVIVGRFQPFHNGHLHMIDKVKQETGLDTFVVVVHPGHNNSKKSPITISVQRVIFDQLVQNVDNMVDYVITNNGYMGTFLPKARAREFEPEVWAAGEDRSKGYQHMIDANEIQGNPEKLVDDFRIYVCDRITSGTEVRSLIQQGEFELFKAKVPQSVAVQWPLIVADFNK